MLHGKDVMRQAVDMSEHLMSRLEDTDATLANTNGDTASMNEELIQLAVICTCTYMCKYVCTYVHVHVHMVRLRAYLFHNCEDFHIPHCEVLAPVNVACPRPVVSEYELGKLM